MVGPAPVRGVTVGGRDLAGRTALVTGASGGLGSELACALAAAGADVIAVGRRADALEAVCDRILAAGGSARPAVADVAHRDELDALCGALDRLDVLVTAAGTQVRRPALEITEDDWQRIVDVNLTGVFFSCQAAARRMLATGGAIVNVTSLTETIGLPGLTAYGATKGGVAQLSRALATEWAPHGIRVNCLAPGRIATAMTADLLADEARTRSTVDRIPAGRLGRPGDLAGAVVFLASSASEYVTGQTLFVDGGWLASGGNPVG